MLDLIYEVDGAVGTITLNRPDARNAYSAELVGGLVGAVEAAARNDAVRALIITGAGRSFSAGGDLKAMHDRSGMFSGDAAELRDNYRVGIQSITRALEAFEKPVIAAISGAAVGAGLGLATLADIRIAADDAKFGAAFTRIGLIPGDGSGYLLARAIGFSRAMELVLTSRIFDVEEARAIGLVHEVVPQHRVMLRAREVANNLAEMPQQALRLAKISLKRSWHSDTENALQLAAAFQALAQHTPEHQEAVAALIRQLER